MCYAKECHAPNFVEKTFVHSHKTAKVFSPLYGNFLCNSRSYANQEQAGHLCQESDMETQLSLRGTVANDV